jgi:hypothetical protein
MFKKLTYITLALSLLLAFGGCDAPFNAGMLQSFEDLKTAHLAVIDTCAVMPALDAGGLKSKQANWQKTYDEAMVRQGGLMKNDDMRKKAFKILNDHFGKNIKDLETAQYPLSTAFVGNIKEHVINDYDNAINGEKGRKGSPVNP